jgi:hypothetical protein
LHVHDACVRRATPWWCLPCLAAACAAAHLPSAWAASAQWCDVRSLFFVAKSENRNQVHYGIHVDEHCAPVGQAPVFAYWRMLERGPQVTEPLLSREVPAYGFAAQRVTSRDAEGGHVLVTLTVLAARPIAIEAHSSGGACAARAAAVVDAAPASLTSVFVRLRWPFGVASLTLRGRALDDGRPVQELVRP